TTSHPPRLRSFDIRLAATTNSPPAPDFAPVDSVAAENDMSSGGIPTGFAANGMSQRFIVQSPLLSRQLDDLDRTFDEDGWSGMTGGAVLGGITVSAGYVLWNIRS